MSSLQHAYSQRRRSSRINHPIPVTIQGSDAFRAPYVERISTLTVSCHGCRYQSKNDVVQGDVVLLELERPESRAMCSSRARVRQVRRLGTKEVPFEVIVELESPGNIWGIPSPPEDWFPLREATATEPTGSGRELRVVARTEQEMATTLGGPAQVSHSKKDEASASLSPFLAQLMVGLGEQIQVMAAEAATAVIVKEEGRLLDEFRAQLQDAATRTLERVITTSKEEMAHRALKELNGAHEVMARATYERWAKKLEQDFGSTAERSDALGNKVIRRLERAAAGVAEHAQSSMDASRRDGVEQFRSGLRNQLTPLLEEAQTALNKLAAFEDELKIRSLAICGQFNDFLQQEADRSSGQMAETISRYQEQFDSSVNERLAKGYAEIDKKSTLAVDACAQALSKLAEACERNTQGSLASVVESTLDRSTNTLKETTATLSSQFSNELERYRRYLEFLSGSIAEIAKKTPVPRG